MVMTTASPAWESHPRCKKDGLIVLAITDEEAGKVKPFVNEYGFSYPQRADFQSPIRSVLSFLDSWQQ